jgi:signal transduction histidine kinase
MQARLDTLDRADSAKALREDIKDISSVVHQLLELAELEADPEPPDELVDLRQIAQEVADNLAPVSTAMGKSVVLEGAAGPVYIHGHHRAIARAIRNLVDNGLAVSSDNAAVTIDVSDEPAVRVIDKGPGIPPEERDLVFRRHWRGRGRPSGHSGLGLAIVARIVDAHKGTVDIGEAPDGGAIVTIHFPMVDDD